MKKSLVFYIVLLGLVSYATATSAQSTHPRLLFDNNDIPNLWSKIGSYPILTKYYDYLRDEAASSLGSPFYNNRGLMSIASDMAFIYLIDESDPLRSDFLDDAVNALNGIYNNATGSTPDLTKSLAIASMSLVYDMLYDELSQSERHQTATNIKELLDDLVNDYYDSNWNQIKSLYGNNHIMSAGSGIGIGIIAIKGDELAPNTTFTSTEAQQYLDVVNPWLQLLDTNMFASDGAGFEGIQYAFVGANPMISYYEILRRDGGPDLFQSSNFQKFHEWAVMELVPAEGVHASISESMFDYNNVNSVNFYNAGDKQPEQNVAIFSALGGIYQNDPTAGAATWNFEHHLNALLDNGEELRGGYAPINIMAITYYTDNAVSSLNSILSDTQFFLARGLIVRDGYDDESSLFTFETNFPYNWEIFNQTGQKKYCWRWDEDDNNSFTFFAFGRRWIIDNGRKNPGVFGFNEELSSSHNTVTWGGFSQPYVDNNDVQMINWYDYHNLNGMYYITNDITDSWVKKINPIDGGLTGGGEEREYATHQAYQPTYQNWVTEFDRARRHAHYVQKDGSIPPYLIIYDDITQDNSTTNSYTFVLHIDAPSSVGSFNVQEQSVTITNQGKVMDIFYHSPTGAGTFYTQMVSSPAFYPPHLRINYDISAINPRFNVVLVPSDNSSSSASDVNFTDLGGQGTLTEVEFSSQNFTD